MFCAVYVEHAKTTHVAGCSYSSTHTSVHIKQSLTDYSMHLLCELLSPTTKIVFVGLPLVTRERETWLVILDSIFSQHRTFPHAQSKRTIGFDELVTHSSVWYRRTTEEMVGRWSRVQYKESTTQTLLMTGKIFDRYSPIMDQEMGDKGFDDQWRRSEEVTRKIRYTPDDPPESKDTPPQGRRTATNELFLLSFRAFGMDRTVSALYTFIFKKRFDRIICIYGR